MTTNNKAVTCYLPKDIEDFITGYCNEYGITRKDKEGHIYPSLGTGIIELLKLLAYNPELVGSPLPDTVPSTISEAAIETKIDEILEKKLSNHLPDNVPSIVESIILDKLPSMILEYLPSDLMARIENMERLLRLQQSASIADHSPIPTGEPYPLPPSLPDRPAIEAVTPEVSPSPLVTDAIVSIDGTVETVNTSPLPPDKLGEGGNGHIFPDSPPDRPAIASSAKKGLTDSELARELGIDKSNITRWKAKGHPTPKYRNLWELRGRLWYEKD